MKLLKFLKNKFMLWDDLDILKAKATEVFDTGAGELFSLDFVEFTVADGELRQITFNVNSGYFSIFDPDNQKEEVINESLSIGRFIYLLNLNNVSWEFISTSDENLIIKTEAGMWVFFDLYDDIVFKISRTFE